MPGIRILAVDDSESIQALLRQLLGTAGHEVVTADSPRQALRVLRIFDPHIILTDFNMPGIDGHAFVRLLRRSPRFDSTPIFVLSSETETLKRDLMNDAGANGWFSKPVCTDQLIAGVQAAARAVVRQHTASRPRFEPASPARHLTMPQR
ncbi:MAG TPA: response regulator [Brevundimonas sp.]|jgi:two-component system chemotaxis response regulator CheY